MDKLNDLNDLMQKGVLEGVYPGATYCLIEDGKRHFGYVGYKALYPEKEENKLDTVYDVASLSKVVATTMAILILCEEGKLSLEDKIKTYLPYIKYDHVTIKDLLVHSSGYPALTEGTTEMTTLEPLMDDLMTCDLAYETGSKVVYSDVGFMYLGFLVEKLTGSLPDYLKTRVFKPLGMDDTRYNHKEILRIAPTEEFGFRGMIRGFVHDEKAFLLDGVAGHAGIYSTAEDLAKFAGMLLNGGQEILKEDTVNRLMVKEMPFDEDYRSLGWIVKDIDGGDVLYHTGYTGTHMIVDIKRQKAFIMLSNRVHPSRENTKIIKFRKRIEKIIYGE
ncbi:beta-lactamase family protein [Acidaminobacter sp. JC074]|uniref:serine hydrolase domain-containing protein n=1 Tax=Acidaminobacter sp. JC074 TaxID=2530199 RepID=UPI001F0D3422|nr:beta-lactamase family protein [Acidaminobacter sp. JC074]MCH4887474.1 beta-lactamase family protein [Acidaminobacter sp. JC074]